MVEGFKTSHNKYLNIVSERYNNFIGQSILEEARNRSINLNRKQQERVFRSDLSDSDMTQDKRIKSVSIPQ